MTAIRSNQKNQAVDALRMAPSDRVDLLWELQTATAQFAGVDARASKRMAFHQNDGIIVRVTHPGGSIVHYFVYPRNISIGGMTILHGGFLYPDSACEVRLNSVDDEPVVLSSRVAHCRQVTGRCHEIGLAFFKEIDLCDFVPGLREELATAQRHHATEPADAQPPMSPELPPVDDFDDLNFTLD